MRAVLFLDPHDLAALTADYLKAYPIPLEIDLIEQITGKPISLADWQKYGLRAEVVVHVLRKAVSATQP